MEEPMKLPDHNPGDAPKTDQKPFSQPHIRRLALIFGIIGLLGILAVAALVFALSKPASNQTQTITPTSY
jgi:hypothetical protein